MLDKLKKYFSNAVLILAIASSANAYAQKGLPVIKASSKTVSIWDGNHFRKDYWSIMPDRKPDYYYLEIPSKSTTVTFVTDQDSISFETTYGQQYDFIILLNGKDSCYTRIVAQYKDFNHYSRLREKTSPDTIPFTLGDSRKVYVSAMLNGSPVGNIQLDLGAGGTVINESSIQKVRINFNQKVNLANSDGINQVRSAGKNLLQIGNLQWDSVSVAVASNMKPHEDLIIGNYLFKDKILEINYDKKILVVHDSLPSQVSSYSKHNVILDNGVIPYVYVTLEVRGKRKSGWAMFDTGARTSILNTDDVSLGYRVLFELAGIFGLQKAITPKINIGNHQLSGFEYKTRDMDAHGLSMILGNDILKRFNLVFDNKNGILYMEPNSLSGTAYDRPDEYYVVRVVAGLLILVAAIMLLLKRKKRQRNKLLMRNLK